MQNLSDTIAAIATASGRGGIGVVRLSGPKTQNIAKKILKTLPKERFAHLGLFYDDDEVIDQGLALFFNNPNSFTGEDVLELHAHGGAIVLDRLLQVCLKHSARLAEPGEFSRRAFLNGKIDLAQAESICDLIDANSQEAARSAVKSLQGEFSKQIHELVNQVIEIRKYIEASIDFTEEEIDFLKEGQIIEKINKILNQLEKVLRAAKQGVLLREGIHVVIAGEPNVGKSTLLNCLTGRDSAIVTEIPGTTRDVLREYIQIDGMPLHIIDTAGLRETQDVIEQEGVRRAEKEIKEADLVLMMTDSSVIPATCPERSRGKAGIQSRLPVIPAKAGIQSNKWIFIKNKIDLSNEKPRIERQNNQTIIYLSAKKQLGIDLLEKYLKEFMGFEKNTESAFIARRRHLDALSRAKKSLENAKQNKAAELIAEELHLVQDVLSEITGDFTTDDLLNQIFSTFCVGK